MAPKSLVWRFFKKNGTKTLCDICGKSLSGFNTTNLWSHLQTKHEKQYNELRELDGEERPNDRETVEPDQNEVVVSSSSDQSSSNVQTSTWCSSPSTQILSNIQTSASGSGSQISSKSASISQIVSSTSLSQTSSVSSASNRSAPILRQSTLGTRFNRLSKTDNEKVTDAIAYLIAVDGEPYSIIEHKGFRHLLNVLVPTYTIPSRTTFSERKVPKLYNDTRAFIITKIRDVPFFGLTTDGWAAPNKHKFIALTCSYIDDDWSLNTHTLACHDLNISNTGENIKKLILNELTQYKIDRMKIAAVTSDRGANVLCAVDLMGFETIPCFGHVINTKMQEMLALPFIAPTLQKIKSIFAALSFSSNLKIHLASCQAELGLPTNAMPSTSKTRWWSEIEQFKFVVRYELALYKMVTTYPDMDQNLLITANDIGRIKAVLLVMEPMQKYVTTLGSETIVTASLIPPLISKLDGIFNKFKYNDVVASFEIRKFFKSIPKFCLDLYIKDKSHVELASYLDPRFKDGVRSDLDVLLEMEIKDVTAWKALSQGQTDADIKKVTDQKIRKSALEELFEEEVATVYDAQTEIALFHSQVKIKITDCPLKWWNNRCSIFPNLNIVARKYLCLSATSVLSERVFSDGKDVMPDNRFRLTDEHTEQLIFLSMNSDIVPHK